MNWLLRLLNLDGLVGESAQKTLKQPKGKGGAAPSDVPASSWITAGEEVEAAHEAEALPWQTDRASGRAWYWRVLRGLLVAALLVVVLVGLRTMLYPPAAALPAPTIDPAESFPTADASGVAERFTTGYLTWDQDDPEARSAVLALDVPMLSMSERFGWDGTGWQVATDVHTITVSAVDETHATVTVVARIATKIDEETTATQWTALAIPVAVSEGRVIVTGQPATVAVPAAVPLAQSETVNPPMDDPETARATKGYAESFFTAYGRDGDVSSLTAPGAGIAGLGGLYELNSVKTWIVYKGTGDTRDARAVVLWKDAAGSLIEQTYLLTLTKVSGGASTRWQVVSVNPYQ